MKKVNNGTVKIMLSTNDGITAEFVITCDELSSEQLLNKIEFLLIEKFEDVYIRTFND